ncbi:Putative uncharacterized protein [Taphrina deformans PYCC 5710]|uniref:Alpha/beta hydrolase fold-3 domain-containing protein n=1 Tax=Taphrina deformans (strain PYCC 5710 / ATCC 11124 / CBS 356.35 / IMI 108563 / JCM 9778 / NBRC 8474) TaxID=1097556 RepID=R4X9B6_TAPDE|nr:Putative uncharacterized protein [Taphrina deformans PYCC 5710]|eukprot:CCG80782.1 Putative uncharacterized protein [Taphrina deformans PYCC 5710]
MALTLYQYLNLASYAVQKIPGVATATARFLTIGPRKGQEDCDLRTVIAVALLKSLAGDAQMVTVERVQSLASRNTPVPDNLWGIRQNFELGNGQEVAAAVEEVMRKTRTPEIDAKILPRAQCTPVSGEWQAERKYKATINDLSPQEQYDLLQEGCTNKEAVLLYFHGGAHYLGNETGHRELVSRITSQFGGKAFSVRYRKSPQEPFPAALTDALAAYEYLVRPPPGALHRPIRPEHIVLAGDSAGGNLAASLMLTLMESRPRFPVPAGMILISPWVDLTHSLPSCRRGENDYLPEMLGEIKSHRPSSAWPADGSQRHFYCSDQMVTHPLVSPIAYEGWRACPPILIQCGAEERLRDEARYLAQHMADEGVVVQFDEWQSMPHVFQMLSMNGRSTTLSLRSMGDYVLAVTRQQQVLPRRVVRNGRGEQKEFSEAEFRRYVREKVKLAMVTSRDNFNRHFKSVL